MQAQISTVVKPLPNWGANITILNNSDRSLTAIALSTSVLRSDASAEPHNPSDTLWVSYQDSVIDPAVKELPPHQELTIPANLRCILGADPMGRVVTGAGFKCDQLGQIATAGIYSDGSTTGDAVLLTRLMLRRSSLLMAIDTASAALSEAGNHNYPRGQLVEQFKKLVDSVSGWYLFPEQQIGRGLFESIIGKLKNLPQGKLGEPFPPRAFITEETARLKQMRVVLWDSEPSLADGGALALKMK